MLSIKGISIGCLKVAYLEDKPFGIEFATSPELGLEEVTASRLTTSKQEEISMSYMTPEATRSTRIMRLQEHLNEYYTHSFFL